MTSSTAMTARGYQGRARSERFPCVSLARRGKCRPGAHWWATPARALPWARGLVLPGLGPLATPVDHPLAQAVQECRQREVGPRDQGVELRPQRAPGALLVAPGRAAQISHVIGVVRRC